MFFLNSMAVDHDYISLDEVHRRLDLRRNKSNRES